MATRKEFCDEMIAVYDNHGVYIGTGNGELTESLKVKDVRKMETNYGYDTATTERNICRDLTYIGNCYAKGWDMTKSRAGDCSGQIVGAMHRLGILPSDIDYSAKMFQTECTDVALKDLKYSDLVFDKKKDSRGKGTAGHVGVFDGEMIVESKNRDAGVVRRPVSEGNWVIGGRLPNSWFDDNVMVLTRILKYIPDNMMRGEDVRQVQMQLQLSGYTPGTADGVFGKKTKIAVQAFQLDNNLEADGIVGKNTATALGFKWEG